MSYQAGGGEHGSSSSIYPRLHHNNDAYEEIPTSPPSPSAPPEYELQNVGNETRRTNLRFKKCLYKIILFYAICVPLLLIGLVFLSVTYNSSPVSSSRTYGEICNRTHILPTRPTTTTTGAPVLNSESEVHERVKRELPLDACDMNLWLECKNITDPPEINNYVCLCPWDLSWDKDVGACVSSPPNACADNHFTDLRPLKCVSNARCRHTVSNEPGVCECNEEYSLTPLGGCRLTYNSTKDCTKDEECNWEVGNLKCIEGKCLCSNQKMWEEADAVCKGRAKTRCNANEPCYRNSGCSLAGLCECNSDFTNNQEGLCVKPYNVTCDPAPGKVECDDTLACLGDITAGYKCLCRDGHVLDPQDMHCRGTSGSDCSKETGGGVSCVDNATCVPNGQASVCTCNEGFEQNGAERLCKKKFSQNCTLSSECNEDKYLTCTLGSCRCATGYRADGEVCKGLVGSTCRVGAECWMNSECPTEGTNKTCQCQSLYYEHTTDKICMGKHGTACTASSPCNPLGLLNCSGTCQCKDPKYIHQESGDPGCVAKAENNCGTNSDPDLPQLDVECVRNATCTANVCKCTGSLVPNTDGKCAASSSILSVSVSLIFMSILILFSNHSN